MYDSTFDDVQTRPYFNSSSGRKPSKLLGWMINLFSFKCPGISNVFQKDIRNPQGILNVAFPNLGDPKNPPLTFPIQGVFGPGSDDVSEGWKPGPAVHENNSVVRGISPYFIGFMCYFAMHSPVAGRTQSKALEIYIQSCSQVSLIALQTANSNKILTSIFNGYYRQLRESSEIFVSKFLGPMVLLLTIASSRSGSGRA